MNFAVLKSVGERSTYYSVVMYCDFETQKNLAENAFNCPTNGFFFPSSVFVPKDDKDDNLGVLKLSVSHVNRGGWPGVGACPAVQGRRPGRTRRRLVRSPASRDDYEPNEP